MPLMARKKPGRSVAPREENPAATPSRAGAEIFPKTLRFSGTKSFTNGDNFRRFLRRFRVLTGIG
jgi:hypothetical protein